jgi:hypothetical protein
MPTFFEALYQIVLGLLVLAIGLFFGGLGLASIAGSLRRRRQSRASRHWLSVHGRVMNSKVETSPGGPHGPHHEPQVRYQYEVSGQRYVGNRISFADISGRMASERVVKRYPRDMPVTVLYDPADPQESALEPAYPASNQGWHLLMGCALIVTPGALCSWVGFSLLAETINKMGVP